MPDLRIDYLIDHPEYVPQLAQWLFEQWDGILGEKTPEVRIRKLKAHMNRDELPIAWVAHANGQLLGTAALRVRDLEGREDLTPWLGEVFVGPDFRRRGIGAICVPPSKKRPGQGTYRFSTFSRSTRKRGTHAEAGKYLLIAFGTSCPVT
jgi:hypothetical protein